MRRYSGPAEQFFKGSSAIVKTGPLDTPILVSGVPVFGKQSDEPAPMKLKWLQPVARVASRWRGSSDPRTMADLKVHPTEDGLVAADGALPEFSPLAGRKTRLIQYTNNPWGLKSWSEMLYPEAYRDISNVYWKQLSDEERRQVMVVQARAMEKVGYEPGTSKYFIDPIESQDDYVVGKGGRMDDTAVGGRSISGEGFLAMVIVLVVLAAALWFEATALSDSYNGAVSAPMSVGESDGE
ncbi:MAG: hypothetical protein M3R04_02215 [bacterium]|nr:hypothetical protein [bacterium]